MEEQCGGREGDRYHRLRGLGAPLPGAKAPGKTLARPGHHSSCTRHSFGKRCSFLHYEDPERNSNSSSETPTSANSWKGFPPLCPEMLASEGARAGHPPLSPMAASSMPVFIVICPQRQLVCPSEVPGDACSELIFSCSIIGPLMYSLFQSGVSMLRSGGLMLGSSGLYIPSAAGEEGVLGLNSSTPHMPALNSTMSSTLCGTDSGGFDSEKIRVMIFTQILIQVHNCLYLK